MLSGAGMPHFQLPPISHTVDEQQPGLYTTRVQSLGRWVSRQLGNGWTGTALSSQCHDRPGPTPESCGCLGCLFGSQLRLETCLSRGFVLGEGRDSTSRDSSQASRDSARPRMPSCGNVHWRRRATQTHRITDRIETCKLVAPFQIICGESEQNTPRHISPTSPISDLTQPQLRRRISS